MSGYMDHLVAFVRDTDVTRLPEGVLEQAKAAFIDTIGVTVAAEREPVVQIAKKVLPSLLQYEADESALVTAFSGNAAISAFMIGVMSHALDYDDVNFTFHGHPSVALIPAILGLAREQDLWGQRMLEAYAIGFEVQARLGEAIGVSQYRRGWHTTSTIGIYGAVAAAGSILKLSEEQIRNAFGIASSMAGGTRKNFGTMTKPLHVGFAAMNAILAVRLAAAGTTASQDIFSEPMSIDLITGGEKQDWSPLLKLGKQWDLLDSGLIFKKYPCCAFTHRAIDATIQLVEQHDLKIADIAKIQAAVHYKVPEVLIYDKPADGLEGKFSMPYCLAKAVKDRKVTLETFEEDAVKDADIDQLMERVETVVHPEQDEGSDPQERFAEVSIHTADGVLVQRVDYPAGHPVNPLSEEEIRRKFFDCVSGEMSIDRAEQLYRALSEAERTTYEQIRRLIIP